MHLKLYLSNWTTNHIEIHSVTRSTVAITIFFCFVEMQDVPGFSQQVTKLIIIKAWQPPFMEDQST